MMAVYRIVSTISMIGAFCAGLILCLMTLLIMVEIVLRTFYNTSTFVAAELIGYGVAGMTFISLGHALDRGALIRVNLLLVRLRPDGLPRRIIEIVCILSTGTVTAMAIWYFGRSILRNYQRGYVSQTTSDIPAWIPESLVLVGLIIFFMQLVALLLLVSAGRPIPHADPARL